MCKRKDKQNYGTWLDFSLFSINRCSAVKLLNECKRLMAAHKCVRLCLHVATKYAMASTRSLDSFRLQADVAGSSALFSLNISSNLMCDGDWRHGGSSRRSSKRTRDTSLLQVEYNFLCELREHFSVVNIGLTFSARRCRMSAFSAQRYFRKYRSSFLAPQHSRHNKRFHMRRAQDREFDGLATQNHWSPQSAVGSFSLPELWPLASPSLRPDTAAPGCTIVAPPAHWNGRCC